MSKHTPGPWVVVYSTRNGAALRVDAPNDSGVPGAVGSVVRQNGIGMPACGIGHANANLIAAAPDLYEAMKALIACCEKHPAFTKPGNAITIGRMEAARAALAKADGVEPFPFHSA